MMASLPLVSVITAILFLLNPGQSKEVTINKTDETTPVKCKTLSYDLKAKAFTVTSGPRQVLTRKNVYSLTATEISALKTGITNMQALPLTDKTSWRYQAAIHGSTLTNNLPSWNSCEHSTVFFLSWHRMYLFFFERILRAKSGNPNLTLPYWNYQTNAVLHPEYRNSAVGNPLYNATRNNSINTGGSLPAAPMTAINNALNVIPFFDFSSFLEGPHGSIHGAIGGNMGNVPTAAIDPVFWLHHSNIDRLWEEWLRKCGGRSNPDASTNATWMNRSYTFFDETGSAVSMTANQILNTASQLNYNYDFPLKLPCNFKLKWWLWKWRRWELFEIRRPFHIVDTMLRLPLREMSLDNFNKFIQQSRIQSPRISSTGPSDKVVFELDQVKINKAPEGVIEVYLNLDPRDRSGARSKSFIGVLDLFTSGGHAQHQDSANVSRIDATTAIRNLGLRFRDLGRATLTFVVRGNSIRGKPVRTTADVEIGSIRITFEEATR